MEKDNTHTTSLKDTYSTKGRLTSEWAAHNEGKVFTANGVEYLTKPLWIDTYMKAGVDANKRVSVSALSKVNFEATVNGEAKPELDVEVPLGHKLPEFAL